jgi:hypothetical protein
VRITGRPKRTPWTRLRVKSTIRTVQRELDAHPGFHRLVLVCRPAGPFEYESLADPIIEPRLRSLFSRIMILDPAEADPDPYVLL